MRLLANDLDGVDDSVLETSAFQINITVSNAGNVEETVIDSSVDAVIIEVDRGTEVRDKKISDVAQEIVKECEHCQNTSEILKCAQEKILTGRQLDITDPDIEISGETNFILVDRENLLDTGLDEISALVNCHLPIEVNFAGESARDLYGGS